MDVFGDTVFHKNNPFDFLLYLCKIVDNFGPKASWPDLISRIHTTASDYQTPSSQIPRDEPVEGIDVCGRKGYGGKTE